MVIESNQLLGHSLGTCTLQSLLGRGGMGAVYLAQQSRPRRAVAVKVLMPGLLLETRIRAEFLARFRREADAIAALDHINIMPIYEYGEQEELAYLVMPNVTGGTLREVLEKRARLPLSEIIPIIEQAAAALDYAHAQGIIHRDLKPGNILFHADGRVVLADFGLAKILNETTEADHEASSGLTSAGAIIGTPEYFSPEQSTGNPVDKRTDVYSLGIVLFQMLSGRVPFTGPTAVSIAVKHTIEEPPPLSQLNPTVPHSVEAVVMKAIAKKPEHRYDSAGELARALRTAAPDISSSQSPDANSEEVTERITPITLMSNDTILEVPIVSSHEAPTLNHHEALTVKSPSPHVPAPHRNTPWERGFSPMPSPIQQHAEKRGGCQSLWMMMLGTVLALLLVIGGVAAYLHALSGASSGSLTSSQLSKTAPTPDNTLTQAAEAQLPAALIAAGTMLYGTTLPACDAQRALWSKSSNARVICGTSATELTDTSPIYLAGTFLDKFPNGYGIPSDYVLQVQVNEAPKSQGGFGVFFRNQPGLIHQGTFTFLLFPSGRWEANVYNDKSGQRTLLHSGRSSLQLDGLITIDILVQGNTFTFYLNGHKEGKAISPSYPSGTIGLATDAGADVFFRNLVIYRLPGS
ncbi:MAG: hypothetical protein NVSMB27_48220 [Ktedonobacteraceae bacterium]